MQLKEKHHKSKIVIGRQLQEDMGFDSRVLVAGLLTSEQLIELRKYNVIPGSWIASNDIHKEQHME